MLNHVVKTKVKVKWIYIAPSHETSKVLRHGSQFYLPITPCLRLPHKGSPDVATTDSWWHLSNCSILLIYRSQKDERLSWFSWLTYSGRFTHLFSMGQTVADSCYTVSHWGRRSGPMRCPWLTNWLLKSLTGFCKPLESNPVCLF